MSLFFFVWEHSDISYSLFSITYFKSDESMHGGKKVKFRSLVNVKILKIHKLFGIVDVFQGNDKF